VIAPTFKGLRSKLVIAMAVTCGFGPVALAQAPARDFPNRPVRIIVGFAAGGGNDIVARLVGEKLSASLGQPVVIENRTGANASIAAEYVKNAAPDGHTLLLGAIGTLALNPALYPKLPYSPLRDFVPLSMVGTYPLIFVVNSASPVRSVQDLATHAKSHPGKVNYGSAAAGLKLVTELFKLKTGAPMQDIPYRGSHESLTAVISGHVLLTVSDTPSVSGHLKAGRIRGLAVTSRTRLTEFPEIPTMTESGVPDMDVGFWAGLVAPAGTPGPIVQRLQDEIMRAVQGPDLRERLRALAIEPVGSTSQEFARVIASDLERWTTVANASRMKLEQ
jgi:tripartite-type tricarboxylate transporter receptor subunit TctC